MDADLAYAGIAELARRYYRGDLSPVEVTCAALERVERQDSRLNAYILVTADLAMEQARAAEGRIRRGDAPPLCGIPYSLKDIFDVSGLPLTCGSNVLRGHVSTTTAFVAKRLADAGAVLLGKNNLLEFAYGETHPDFGPTRNPWNLNRSTAGSSTGSAASVCAGQAYFSVGTDTGGSIRLPASYCGLAGVKPTYGRVSRSGLRALCWSCDFVGPLTRSAADAALVLETIAGFDPADPTSGDRPVPDYVSALAQPVRGLRVGVVRREFEEHLHPEVRDAALAAVDVLRDLGLEVVDVEPPPFEHAVLALLTILFVEAASIHRPWMEERPEGYSAAVLERLRMGALIPGVDYLHAQRARRMFRDGIARVFEHVDVLVTPTSPTAAHDFSEEVPGRDFTPYVRRTGPFNLTGYPAISIPCGFSTDGLPLGLQIVARYFAEDVMFRVADAYQRVTDWHRRRPPAVN